MRKLSPAGYVIQTFPYQIPANGRWVMWSIDHSFVTWWWHGPILFVIYPDIQSAFVIKTTVLTFQMSQGWIIWPAEPRQEAENSPRWSWKRLLLSLADVFELPLPPGVQPDHDDHHLGLGEQGVPLPRHLLTADSRVIIYKDNQLVRNMNCGTEHLPFLFLIMRLITHKEHKLRS